MAMSASLSIGPMTDLLQSVYASHEEAMSNASAGYAMSPASSTCIPSPSGYCTVTPNGSYPIYAALQAANDSPPQNAAVSAREYYHVASCTEPRPRSTSLESEQEAKTTASMSSRSGLDDDAHFDEDGKDLSYQDNVSKWLNQQACGGMVKRKRRINKTQRLAANKRERRRMGTFNEAFERLRDTMHSPGGHSMRRKKMSRIQTLKSAISYIGDLSQLLQESDNVEELCTGSEGTRGGRQDRDVQCW